MTNARITTSFLRITKPPKTTRTTDWAIFGHLLERRPQGTSALSCGTNDRDCNELRCLQEALRLVESLLGRESHDDHEFVTVENSPSPHAVRSFSVRECAPVYSSVLTCAPVYGRVLPCVLQVHLGLSRVVKVFWPSCGKRGLQKAQDAHHFGST